MMMPPTTRTGRRPWMSERRPIHGEIKLMRAPTKTSIELMSAAVFPGASSFSWSGTTIVIAEYTRPLYALSESVRTMVLQASGSPDIVL